MNGQNAGEFGKPWGQMFQQPQQMAPTAVPNTPPGAPMDLRQIQQNAQKEPIMTPAQLMQPGNAGGQPQKPGIPMPAPAMKPMGIRR